MTTQEAQKRIEKAGYTWEQFCEWMYGQTIGGTPNNPDWFEVDVERFCRNGPQTSIID